MIPWFSAAALVLIGVGLYIGFFVAPTDFQQGDVPHYSVHVPAARMSMFLVMSSWPHGPASGWG
jgi:heme exporter protein C